MLITLHPFFSTLLITLKQVVIYGVLPLMLLTEIHAKFDVEEGKEALAIYFHPKLKAKHKHLMFYEFVDQLGPIFGEFMRCTDVAEGCETLNLKMALFCNLQK